MSRSRYQDSTNQQKVKIVGFATQGPKSGDAVRLRVLLSRMPSTMYEFERSGKVKEFLKLLGFIRLEKPDFVVMEGTGIAGGFALIIARILWGLKYVVSSGDAVGPFVRMFHPWIGIAFSLYERILCRLAAGFIGWTPYLAGRALTFGTPRAMTAPGWAHFQKTEDELALARNRIRSKLNISENTVVIGIVGSLDWNPRVGFCYGYELVKAIRQSGRKDVVALIVGDGTGKSNLEKLAGSDLGKRIILTGRVPRDEVPDYLAAMDMASLPQSLDGVGNFRYTTKISEYVAAHLPIVTGNLPMTYDLPAEWFTRISGAVPWATEYIENLTRFLEQIRLSQLKERRFQIISTALSSHFNKEQQIESVTQFVIDLVGQTTNEERTVSPVTAAGLPQTQEMLLS